jgi:hypothetical protein
MVGGIILKKTMMTVIAALLVLLMAASVCAAKDKKDDQAKAQEQTLAHVQQANALTQKFTCRYDEEADVYTFVPNDAALARLSGKAATMIPSVAYAGKDGAVLFRILFSYGGLEYLDMTDVTLTAGGRDMSFAVPEGATVKEQQTGYVTEDYAAGFDGDILNDFYAFATSAASADTKDVLKLTGKTTEVSRPLTAFDKEVLKEAIEIYRALEK